MKKLLLVLLLLSSTVSFSQTIRNSLLGVYTGTYWNYGNSQPVVTAGVKITAHPTDTAGIIFHDTINNVLDTIQILLGFDVFGAVVDTGLWNYWQMCGDIIPAQDSIFYAHFPPPGTGNPSAEFSLRCTQHYLPTSIATINVVNLMLYPNPTREKLYFKSDTPLTSYTIYNVLGQKIMNGNFENNNITISTLIDGIYYIRVKAQNGETIKRFIKN